MTPARAAYEAYYAAANGRSLASGLPLPTFDELPEATREAWAAAAEAAQNVSRVLERDPDGRVTLKLATPIKFGNEEITELRFRNITAKDMRTLPLPERRTVGHHLDLIAKACGQPPGVIDQLEGEDLVGVSALIGGF
jgi:hypothetical protein